MLSLRAARRLHDWLGTVTGEHAGPAKPRPPSADQVTELTRDLIRQLAPEELAVFDSVAEAWLADGGRQRPGKSPGGSVGFGVEEVLLTQLTFPIIAAALGEVLGNATEERVRGRLKSRKRRAAAAAEQVDGAGAAKSSDSAARDVLTGQQAACASSNRTMQEVFRAPPTDLRHRRHRADRLAADGGLTLRLPVVPGYDWDAMRAFLAARAATHLMAYGDTLVQDPAPV